jgi:hypothetical protein
VRLRRTNPAFLTKPKKHPFHPFSPPQVGGISLGEINTLEVEFLTRLDFRLHVQPEEFDAVCERLGRRLQPCDYEGGAADAVAAAEGGAAPAPAPAYAPEMGADGYTRAVATA